MFIDCKDLVGGSRDVDLIFPRPAVDGVLGSGEPVHLSGQAVKVGQGIRITGHLEARVTIPCARCNEPYDMDLDTPVRLLYANGPMQARAEVGLSESDLDLAELDESGRVDIVRLTREQIYLALPLKPICGDSCRGLCSRCGANLNKGLCICSTDELDPNWSALRSL